MIKVPFDTEGCHGASIRGQTATRIELEKTVEHAYETMDWFKYLADNAVRVEVLDTQYIPEQHLTTTVVGFELEGKHETYYRLKYNS